MTTFLDGGFAGHQEPKKANHRAPIVRIQGFDPIPDADKIHRVYVGGVVGDEYAEMSFVSQKNTFQVGDLAVFIQPDSIVPATENFSYLWANGADPEGIRYGLDFKNVPASQRRVTVRRFKKVWSEGLLVPIREMGLLDGSTFYASDNFLRPVVVGQDVSDILGIEHYDADEVIGDYADHVDFSFIPRKKKRYPKTFVGWFHFLLHLLHVKRNSKFLRGPQVNLPVYDVENFKNYSRTFVDGEDVMVTEKIHGSSARFVAIDGVMYAGSRKQWVSPAGGGYPVHALQYNPWIETWCRRNEGFALYGEVTPRQKGFNYASEDKVRFWLFDIRNPAGQWLDADDIMYLTLPSHVDMVPLLYHAGYNKTLIDGLVEGKSVVPGTSHIREGIVIKTTKTDYRRGVGRAQLKIVSNAFLEKDGKLTKE